MLSPLALQMELGAGCLPVLGEAREGPGNSSMGKPSLELYKSPAQVYP